MQASSAEKEPLTDLSEDIQRHLPVWNKESVQNEEKEEGGIQSEDQKEEGGVQSEDQKEEGGLQSEDQKEEGGVQSEDQKEDGGVQSEDQNVKNEEGGVQSEYQNEDEDIQNIEFQYKKESKPNCLDALKRLKKAPIFWYIVSIVFAIIFFTAILLLREYKMQRQIKEKAETNNKLQQKVSLLKQDLRAASQDLRRVEKENSQLKLQLNATVQHVAGLSAAKAQLKLQLNSTVQHVALLSAAKVQVELLLNNTLQEKAEQLHTLTQMKDKNIKLLSVLSSNKLSFVWHWCQKDTLQCSRCPPGWTEHAFRCFLLSQTALKWEEARRDCLNRNGDLAVVLTAKDQVFLTNMTFQFVRGNPTVEFHSTWIGLQDTVQEGTFMWVNGEKLKTNLAYWREMEPNNAIATYDTDLSGQDCVAIIPPKNIITPKWQNSWDDIICGGKRHYICETPAFVLP